MRRASWHQSPSRARIGQGSWCRHGATICAPPNCTSASRSAISARVVVLSAGSITSVGAARDQIETSSTVARSCSAPRRSSLSAVWQSVRSHGGGVNLRKSRASIMIASVTPATVDAAAFTLSSYARAAGSPSSTACNSMRTGVVIARRARSPASQPMNPTLVAPTPAPRSVTRTVARVGRCAKAALAAAHSLSAIATFGASLARKYSRLAVR